MWTYTYRPENVRVLRSRHQVRTLGDARGRLQFITRQHPYLGKSFSWWTPTLSRVHLWKVSVLEKIFTHPCFQHHRSKQPKHEATHESMDGWWRNQMWSIHTRNIKQGRGFWHLQQLMSETNQSQKDKHRMIPPDWGPQRSQTRRDRQEMVGARAGGGGASVSRGQSFSFTA